MNLDMAIPPEALTHLKSVPLSYTGSAKYNSTITFIPPQTLLLPNLSYLQLPTNSEAHHLQYYFFNFLGKKKIAGHSVYEPL